MKNKNHFGNKIILYPRRDPFGPNKDTLEYLLENYHNLSVTEAIDKALEDSYGASIAP